MSSLLEIGEWYREGVDELYIPGPIDVRPEVLHMMSARPYGHRVPEDMNKVIKSIREDLFDLVNANEDTHSLVVSGGSGTYALEMAARSWGRMQFGDDVSAEVLVPSIGLFGDLWGTIFRKCCIPVDEVRSADGGVVDLDELEAKLQAKDYSIVAVTHNDTSTATVNPIDKIAKIVNNSPSKPLFFVDGVSSVGGMPIDVTEMGIDFLATAPQKAIGALAGLKLGVARKDALGKTVEHGKGLTTDISQHTIESSEKGMTLTTPPQAQMGAVALQLAFIREEGKENRYARHQAMADTVRAWGEDEGFELLPALENASNTLTCFVNTRGIDLTKLQHDLRRNEPIRYGFDAGHPKLAVIRQAKGLPDTFRVAHMGDRKPEALQKYLDTLSWRMAGA